MAILKCKMCGAPLNITEGASVCTCEYCNLIQTTPNCDNEKIVSLYNRANALRLRKDFDQAASTYQSIINTNPDEAEAHWGLLLCKYGIEYVDDPKTGEKKPTCHRTHIESILNELDYEETLKNADVVGKELYQKEAKEIDRIQKKILEISSKQEPFDVFISFKENDEAGNRTEDSVIAQDLYDKITEKGYKVFFSRITLENRLGEEYEPIIFSALRSAKIMVVIGTKEEYFNAVWVKNEWSRFLAMMEHDSSKSLVPCFKGMSAYELPVEFAPLQSLDMSKLGYYQDLIRYIQKTLGDVNTKSTPTKEVEKETSTSTRGRSRLSKNTAVELIENFISDGNFVKAEELLYEHLKDNGDDARTFYYQAFTRGKIKNLNYFAECKEDPFQNKYFESAYKLADEELKTKLDKIVIQNVKNNTERVRINASKLEAKKEFPACVNLYEGIHNLDRSIEDKAFVEREIKRFNILYEVHNSIIPEKTRAESQILSIQNEIEFCGQCADEYKPSGKKAFAFSIVSLVFLLASLILGFITYTDGYSQDSELVLFIIHQAFVLILILLTVGVLLMSIFKKKGSILAILGVFGIIGAIGSWYPLIIVDCNNEYFPLYIAMIICIAIGYAFNIAATESLKYAQNTIAYDWEIEHYRELLKPNINTNEQCDARFARLSQDYYNLTGVALEEPVIHAKDDYRTKRYPIYTDDPYPGKYLPGSAGLNKTCRILHTIFSILGSATCGIVALAFTVNIPPHLANTPISHIMLLSGLWFASMLLFTIIDSKRKVKVVTLVMSILNMIMCGAAIFVFFSDKYTRGLEMGDVEVFGILFIVYMVFFAITFVFNTIRVVKCWDEE